MTNPTSPPSVPDNSNNGAHRTMLVIDSSFTYEAITQRGLQESVTCRDLGGFFEHVWTVHPFASLLTSPSWAPRYGTAQSYEVDERHTFIEGKVGLSHRLARLFPVNFLFGQMRLYLQLRRLVREQKVSVIRAGDPLYLALLGLVISRSTGVPLLVRVGSNNDKIYQTTGKPNGIDKPVLAAVTRHHQMVGDAQFLGQGREQLAQPTVARQYRLDVMAA
jgi:hypothetical protein